MPKKAKKGKGGGKAKKGGKKGKKEGKKSKKESVLKDALANAKLWETKLEGLEKSRQEYRDNAKRLLYENDILQMQMSNSERDTLEVISFLKQEDSKKDEQISLLQQTLKEVKREARKERQVLVDEYSQQIHQLTESLAEKTNEVKLMQSELKLVKEFRRKRAQMQRELDEIKETMYTTEKHHKDTLQQMEHKFFEEKIRLQQEASKKIAELAERAHSEAIAGQASTKRKNTSMDFEAVANTSTVLLAEVRTADPIIVNEGSSSGGDVDCGVSRNSPVQVSIDVGEIQEMQTTATVKEQAEEIQKLQNDRLKMQEEIDRLKTEVSKLEQAEEIQKLQNDRLKMQEEIDILKKEELNGMIVQEKIVESKQQKKQISELEEKVRTLEKSLSHVVREFEAERAALVQTAENETRNSRAEISRLQRIVELKTKEMNRVKRLAKTILDQRTEVEQFFLDSLEYVKNEIVRNRIQYRKDAQNAYQQRMLEAHAGHGDFPRVRTFRQMDSSTNNVFDDLKEAERWTGMQGKVDLTELTWEQRERILRLLFAKMNGFKDKRRPKMQALEPMAPNSQSKTLPSTGEKAQESLGDTFITQQDVNPPILPGALPPVRSTEASAATSVN
ncbi:PREDICTED: basal body-orientation factor 1-like [Acropora digitifera]|uniref:basal body-orientation factor 1-like n=1 Tax=Acropora digitifera TaxID=70779 RepID=UPI00077A821B|nr:PREDICTED: basal body-orientation factor 1-like [Acropora digitifera]